MRAFACAAVLALLATPAAFAAESANYTNLLHVFSSGGGNASSTNYIMDGCIGQAAIGETVDTVDSDKKSVSWFAPVFFGMPITITLDAGYTLIALPCYPDLNLTSQTLIETINAKAGSSVCSTVIRYQLGEYEAYSLGDTPFPIVVGEGYFVLCSQAASLTVNGYAMNRSSVSLDLNAGYTLAGLAINLNSPYTSQNALEDIGPDATQVIKYENGQYVTYSLGDTPFNLELGRGYFINTNNLTTWPITQ